MKLFVSSLCLPTQITITWVQDEHRCPQHQPVISIPTGQPSPQTLPWLLQPSSSNSCNSRPRVRGLRLVAEYIIPLAPSTTLQSGSILHIKSRVRRPHNCTLSLYQFSVFLSQQPQNVPSQPWCNQGPAVQSTRPDSRVPHLAAAGIIDTAHPHLQHTRFDQ